MRPTETSREHLLSFSADPELRRRWQVLDEPIPGNLRFGLLLEVLDALAGEIAVAYARPSPPRQRIVTAALDEIVVRQVADVARDVRCRARINQVGRSSMEVGIRVESAGEPSHLASCYFTMVARQGEGASERAMPLPPLRPEDELERSRVARAEARRAALRREAAMAFQPPTAEEFQLLSDLYRAQEAPGFGGLLARQLALETWERTYPEQDNPWKTIFGGHLMRRAYELSSLAAELVATHRPVLAAVNRVHFIRPVQIGDKLHLTSRVVYTAGPAVCVETSIERISRDRTARALSNSCLFTFLNVDAALRPHDVPPVYPGSHAEEARYLAARRNLGSLAQRTTKGWLASGLTPGAAGGSAAASR
jgi:acyl-coenzyme A thioesterase 9